MSYLDLGSTCVKTSFYYYLRVIGEVCGGKRVHFDSVHCRDHPLAPALHSVRCKAGIGNQQCLHKRQWAHRPWHSAGLGAGARCPQEPGSPASICTFCGASLGPTPSWHGIPGTWLTAGIDKHLISCAGFLVFTTSNLVIFKLLQFLHAFFSFFDFHVCVGLCLRATRSENVLKKHKQGWNKWQPSTCSSLNNPCIYFGNVFMLILFPVLIWI